MTQPDDDLTGEQPTPDDAALRGTRSDPDRSTDDLATGQGPATTAENAVDEALGGAES